MSLTISSRCGRLVARSILWTLATSAAAAFAQSPKEPPKDAGTAGKLLPWQRVLQGDDARTVAALEKQVADSQSKGQFVDGIEPARQALAIRRRVQGDDHWQTINCRIKEQTCMRGADLTPEARSDLAASYSQVQETENLRHAGRGAEAERIDRKLLAVVLKLLGNDHSDTATLYNNLAADLAVQGKYFEAEPLYQKAQEILRRAVGEDHPLTAVSYTDFAANLLEQGRYVEAEPLLKKALGIKLRALGENHSETAISYHTLALNLNYQGKYSEAGPLFEKAMAIQHRMVGENHLYTAVSCGALAYNLNSQGKYSEAEPLLYRALKISLRVMGEEHNITATAYHNLAANYHFQGKYAEAEPLFQKAISSFRRLLGEDHPTTVGCYHSIANNLRSQGKYAESEKLYAQIITIRARTLGDDHPGTAEARSEMGSNLLYQGKYAEAEPLLRSALATHRRVFGEDHRATSISSGNLAAVLFAQGKISDATVLFQKNVGISRRIMGADHPDTAAAEYNLALSFGAEGKYADARAMASAAAASFEHAAAHVSPTSLDRAPFAHKQSPLALLAALEARLERRRDAWQYWEASLARGLFDELATRRNRPFTPDETGRQEDLVGQLAQVDNQIGALAGTSALANDHSKKFDDLRGRRLELQGRRAQLEADLIGKYGVAAGAVYGLEQIQAQLPAGAALVGWIDVQTPPNAADPQGDHWACVVRRTGSPTWVRIKGTGPGSVWTAADVARPGQVGQLLSDGRSSAWQARLAELADQRLGSIDPVLDATASEPAIRHLIILPSPELARIPVEALIEARPAVAAHYLVSYAPSGTMFAWIQERRIENRKQHPQPQPLRLLALGDPVPAPSRQPGAFADKPPDRGPLAPNASPASNAGNAGTQPGDVLLSLRQTRGIPFTRLPGTRREVEAIASLFDDKDVYLGSEASEQLLDGLRRQDKLKRYSVIHLATHGKMDDLIPMNSRLLLSQDQLTDPATSAPLAGRYHDGTITAGEVMSTWKLNAELVVLSACQSGLGRSSGGEGFIGFAQAFFLAGSRSLILSLWEVDDRATALLMTRFYENWLGKRKGLDKPLPKVRALGEAKEWLRGLTNAGAMSELRRISRGEPRNREGAPIEAHPFDHPYYWAAFILVGDPG